MVCDIKQQLQDAFGNNQTLHWEDKIANRWYLASKTLCPCFCFLFLLPKPRLFYGRGRRSTWLAQLGNRRSTEQEFGSRLDFLVFSDKDEKRPGVLAIMPYTGRLRPKGVPFSGLRYIWKGRYFASWSIWKGREICHLGLWKSSKGLTDDFYGFIKSRKRFIFVIDSYLKDCIYSG